MMQQRAQETHRHHSRFFRMRALFVSKETRAYFVENLAMELSSGLDVLQALDGLLMDVRSFAMRGIVAGMREDIDNGYTLWQSLDRTGLLTSDMIALVKIGEAVGRLPENLNVIVGQTQKDHDFRSRLHSAMLYPIFVLGLTVVVGIGVAWFILPRLSDIFSSLHVELPLITVALIEVGRFFSSYGTIAVPALLAGLFVSFMLFFVVSPTKIVGQWFFMHTPGVGKLLTQVEIARFGFVLGTLLQAGLPIVDAMHALLESSALYRYKRFYRFLLRSTTDGNSLKESFSSYRNSRKVIPGPIQQMVLAAEKTGNLPATLLRIGKNFETKTETTTKNLSIILEPILLVIVWLGVVAVALAVVLPVYSLIGEFTT